MESSGEELSVSPAARGALEAIFNPQPTKEGRVRQGQKKTIVLQPTQEQQPTTQRVASTSKAPSLLDVEEATDFIDQNLPKLKEITTITKTVISSLSDSENIKVSDDPVENQQAIVSSKTFINEAKNAESFASKLKLQTLQIANMPAAKAVNLARAIDQTHARAVASYNSFALFFKNLPEKLRMATSQQIQDFVQIKNSVREKVVQTWYENWMMVSSVPRLNVELLDRGDLFGFVPRISVKPTPALDFHPWQSVYNFQSLGQLQAFYENKEFQKMIKSPQLMREILGATNTISPFSSFPGAIVLSVEKTNFVSLLREVAQKGLQEPLADRIISIISITGSILRHVFYRLLTTLHDSVDMSICPGNIFEVDGNGNNIISRIANLMSSGHQDALKFIQDELKAIVMPSLVIRNASFFRKAKVSQSTVYSYVLEAITVYAVTDPNIPLSSSFGIELARRELVSVKHEVMNIIAERGATDDLLRTLEGTYSVDFIQDTARRVVSNISLVGMDSMELPTDLDKNYFNFFDYANILATTQELYSSYGILGEYLSIVYLFGFRPRAGPSFWFVPPRVVNVNGQPTPHPQPQNTSFATTSEVVMTSLEQVSGEIPDEISLHLYNTMTNASLDDLRNLCCTFIGPTNPQEVVPFLTFRHFGGLIQEMNTSPVLMEFLANAQYIPSAY